MLLGWRFKNGNSYLEIAKLPIQERFSKDLKAKFDETYNP